MGYEIMVPKEGKKIGFKGGKLVVPGFTDAHTHFMNGGFQLSWIDLRDTRSPEEFARRIAERAAKSAPGKWILGGDWDHEMWPGAPLPTRELVDPSTRDIPVFISRLDGHMALANTVVLRIPQVELGQGTFTGLSQILADELDVVWSDIRPEFYDPGYNLAHDNVYVWTATLGSQGVSSLYEPARQAAARRILR